jgi:undecaprenyl-diphosphatase
MFLTFSPVNEIILSLILGIVQGITEFLPISSTAHLLLVSKYVTRSGISLAASDVIQFGTFIAIVQYFWEDVSTLSVHIFRSLKSPASMKNSYSNIVKWVKDPNQLFDIGAKQDIVIAQIITATLPIAIVAIILRKSLEDLRTSLYYIAIFLTIGGILIVYAELMHIKKFKTRKSKVMSFQESLTVGLFQSLSVFPGISRSGSALAGGLFLGRNRAESVRFSFLISLPAIGLASAYDLFKVIGEFRNGQIPLLPTASFWTTKDLGISILGLFVAFIVAYLVGLFCLKFLLKYLANNDSKIFVLYRIILVIFIIATYSWTSNNL